MYPNNPRLYATLVNSATRLVRHLLIIFVDGSNETRLLQIDDGLETLVTTGTEYETRQKADLLAQQWITEEGFVRPREGYAFEPLRHTISLAMKMGFTCLYDPRFKSLTWPHPNFTGAVRLAEWPGMTPKNGGGYIYALDQMRLHAQPTLPPSSSPLVAPKEGKEFVAFLARHTAALKEVGPFQEFILAGD